MIDSIIEKIYPLPQSRIELIKSIIKIEDIKKGTDFVLKGNRSGNEYFVIEGVCRSYVLNPEGQPVTISFYIDSSVISPCIIRTYQDQSQTNLQALTHAKVARMDAAIFAQMMVDDIEIRNFANTVLQNELIHKVQKEIGLASLTAKQRLIRFRQEYPLLENLVSHADIATYLGITTISLSRLRKELMQ